MKTFYHDEPHALIDLLKTGWSLYRCDVEGEWRQPVEPSFIADYHRQTWSYWGSYPSDYILATTRHLPADTALTRLFRTMENEAPDLILLVGYNDGGFFSVSQRYWPFQDGARETPRWRPLDIS